MKSRKKITVLLVTIVAYCFISGSNCIGITSGTADWSQKPIVYQFINLDKSTDRRHVMEQQLNQTRIKYSRISAVYGSGMSKQKLEDVTTSAGLLLRNRNLRPAEVALYVTTAKDFLPSAISNSNGISVVFEDDVVIPFDVDFQFRQSLKAVPEDADILFLGCYQHYRFNASGVFISPFTPTNILEAAQFSGEICPASANLRQPGTPWVKLTGKCIPGTWAYAVNSDSAKRLTEKIKEIHEPIDMAYVRLTSTGDIKAYCLNPELIRTTEYFPSTIR